LDLFFLSAFTILLPGTLFRVDCFEGENRIDNGDDNDNDDGDDDNDNDDGDA
jgi:hypothetical protein